MTAWHMVALGLAAFLAGGVNAVAGGGTLITFSVLLGVGLDPRIANATSCVALWPGSLGGAIPHVAELRSSRRELLLFGLPSLIGGGLGSLLLLYTPSSTFQKLIPALMLFATVVFALRGQGRPVQPGPTLARTAGVVLFQLVVGIYGGYFGAGIGILMLAALGFLGISNLNQANGIKNILAMCINGVAVVIFILFKMVYWPAALLMTLCSILGGYQGGTMSRRLGPGFTRGFVMATGVVMACVTFYQAYLAQP